MPARSFTFSHAITRRPGIGVVDGLRAVDIGAPDIDAFLRHHDDYIDALESTGAVVQKLPALDAFPDSVFVEDVALCLPEVAIAMRPGPTSRRGEVAAILPTLAQFYDNILAIDERGRIEGGDILTTEREILAGTSARTDSTGIEELRRLLEPWQYKVREVETPAGILHFKTDCAVLDEETILTTPRLSASGCFAGYDLIHTVEGEEACANAVRFNQIVLMPSGFPRTAERLARNGYNIREIGNTEAAKLDGGMSCLSLRFSPG
ncbi:MAG: dimethylarginine dimethylaminohydrolase family protein [Hyphomicrobiaceae bacterium]